MAEGDHRHARAWRRTSRCVRRLDGRRHLRGEGLLLRGRVLPSLLLPLYEWRTTTGSGAKRILGSNDSHDNHRPRGRRHRATGRGIPAILWPRAGAIQRITQRNEFNMEIKRSGSQPSNKGPADWFTGTVRIDPLFQANAPARAFGASVTFEPGARTAWHTHPLGQTLIVTAGCGRAQRWGGPVEEIRPGDVVWIPPGEKHWHGAAPTTAMTHIAIQEQLDGKAVEWMEKVTDEQYKS